jgi:hypothetical protein
LVRVIVLGRQRPRRERHVLVLHEVVDDGEAAHAALAACLEAAFLDPELKRIMPWCGTGQV